MKAYYDTNSVASQLTEVKPSTLKSQGKPFPKLRAKGADPRALVPFCQQLCVSLMDPRIPLGEAAPGSGYASAQLLQAVAQRAVQSQGAGTGGSHFCHLLRRGKSSRRPGREEPLQGEA